MSEFRHRAVLVLIVLLTALAVRLGIWQLDRLAERRASNAELLAARDLAPLDLTAPSLAESLLVGRRIVATGRFDSARTVLLRNRAFRDAPGLYVLSPFQIEGSDRSIWVLRGFVNAADGVRPTFPLPAFKSGLITIDGIALAPTETKNAGQPLGIGSDTTWQRPDSVLLAERSPGSLPILVQLVSPDTVLGGLPTIEPPELSEGPHLSYAVQWFAIATAIGSFGWFIVRRRGGRARAQPPETP